MPYYPILYGKTLDSRTVCKKNPIQKESNCRLENRPLVLDSDQKPIASRVVILGIWQDAIGKFHGLVEENGACLAKIGPVTILLPSEMSERLQGLVGQRIGILRCDDGFRLRTYEDKSRDEEA